MSLYVFSVVRATVAVGDGAGPVATVQTHSVTVAVQVVALGTGVVGPVTLACPVVLHIPVLGCWRLATVNNTCKQIL